MRDQSFFNEVVSPYHRFLQRASENVCIPVHFSDVAATAQEAALAAYHYREAIHGKQTPFQDEADEHRRQRICDVADSRKHNQLKDARRNITLSSTLAFERNDEGKFKFLRTEVEAESARHGSFLLNDELALFINLIVSEMQDFRLSVPVELLQYSFLPHIETYVTNKTFRAPDLRLRIYQKDSGGKLVATEAAGAKFVVLEDGKAAAWGHLP